RGRGRAVGRGIEAGGRDVDEAQPAPVVALAQVVHLHRAHRACGVVEQRQRNGGVAHVSSSLFSRNRNTSSKKEDLTHGPSRWAAVISVALRPLPCAASRPSSFLMRAPSFSTLVSVSVSSRSISSLHAVSCSSSSSVSLIRRLASAGSL